jgi:hypothetical protein
MLRQSLHQLSLHTRGEGFTNITPGLDREIGASGLASGLANLACLHTSCSLTINENADPRVPHEFVWPIGGQGDLRPHPDRRSSRYCYVTSCRRPPLPQISIKVDYDAILDPALHCRQDVAPAVEAMMADAMSAASTQVIVFSRSSRDEW